MGNSFYILSLQYNVGYTVGDTRWIICASYNDCFSYSINSVYIDGNCDYVIYGSSSSYDLMYYNNGKIMAYVIFRVNNQCSGTLYVKDNKSVIIGIPINVNAGVYGVGIILAIQ